MDGRWTRWRSRPHRNHPPAGHRRDSRRRTGHPRSPGCCCCADRRIRLTGGRARGVDAVAIPVAHHREVPRVAEDERRGGPGLVEQVPLPGGRVDCANRVRDVGEGVTEADLEDVDHLGQPVPGETGENECDRVEGGWGGVGEISEAASELGQDVAEVEFVDQGAFAIEDAHIERLLTGPSVVPIEHVGAGTGRVGMCAGDLDFTVVGGQRLGCGLRRIGRGSRKRCQCDEQQARKNRLISPLSLRAIARPRP